MIPGVDHNKLRGYIVRRVGHQDADDVLQTVYLKLLQSPHDPSKSTINTWAVTIAGSVIVDHLRKQTKHQHEEPDIGVGKDDAQFAQLMARVDVAHALRSIDPLNAAALCAYAQHGTYKDAAEALDISVNTFRHRLNQARLELRGQA